MEEQGVLEEQGDLSGGTGGRGGPVRGYWRNRGVKGYWRNRGQGTGGTGDQENRGTGEKEVQEILEEHGYQRNRSSGVTWRNKGTDGTGGTGETGGTWGTGGTEGTGGTKERWLEEKVLEEPEKLPSVGRNQGWSPMVLPSIYYS